MVKAVQAIIDGKDTRLIVESGLFLETVKTSLGPTSSSQIPVIVAHILLVDPPPWNRNYKVSWSFIPIIPLLQGGPSTWHVLLAGMWKVPVGHR